MKGAAAAVLLGAVLVGAALLALCVGVDGVGLPWRMDADLLRQILPLRLTRVLLAIVVGAGLAASGAVLQALLRNPLADPYVLGVSGGAALGAALASSQAAALGTFAGLGLGAGATIGAVGATLILIAFLLRDPAARSETALLVGVTLNAFSWALVALLRAVLPASTTQTLSVWLIGTLTSPSQTDVVAAGAVTAVALAVLLARRRVLAVLATGVDEALRVGVDARREQRVFLLLTSLLVGAAVATSGVIGFLGLIAPHAVRALFGRAHPLHLALSALLGAITLVVFDALARGAFVWFDSELPTGALCAAVGAPLFSLLLWRHVVARGRV